MPTDYNFQILLTLTLDWLVPIIMKKKKKTAGMSKKIL